MVLYAIEGNKPAHLLPTGSKYRKDLSEMATKKTNTTGTKTPVAEAVKTEAVKAAAEVKADAVKAVKAVVQANEAHVPPYGLVATLYVRPYMFGSNQVIGVKPADEYPFKVLTKPFGP